ncbi:MAG: type IV secretion system protein TraC [Pseudomonadota bacterium]
MAFDFADVVNRLGGRVLGDHDLIDAPERHVEADQIAREILPYRAYDKKTGLYLNRKSIGFVVEIVPLLGADDRIVNILADLFRDGIEDHTHIQVISWASPRVGHILENWRKTRDGAGGVYETLARHRADHLQNAVWTSLSSTAPFNVRNFRVVIAAGVESDDFEAKAPMLQSLCDSMMATLRNIGSDARLMEPALLIGFLDEILNPRRSAETIKPAYNPRDYIHGQIVRSDTRLETEEDAIKIRTTARKPHSTFRDPYEIEEDDYERKTYEARCFTVKSFPDEFAQWRMSKLIGDFFADRLRLPCPTLTVLGVSYPSSTAATARMQIKSTRSTQQSRTSFAAYQPSIKEKAADCQWALEQAQNGQKFVQVAYSAIVIAEEDTIENADKAIRNIYKNAGWDLTLEPLVQLQTFALGLPLTLADGLHDDLARFLRTKTEVTRTCANLAPLQGEFLGQKAPHMLLVSRRGQPYYWSVYGNLDGNHNSAVMGKSGSGKSVWLQDQMTSLRGAGAAVIVIDDGRSFENSAKLQGGAFVEFSLKKAVCLNPFAMVDETRTEKDKDYRADVLSLIKLTVQQMARSEVAAKDAEKGFIDQAVMAAWNDKGRTATIEDVCRHLRDAGDLIAKDLAQSVAPYVDTGAYGDFFNGPSSLDISNDLTVFEMAELESKPDVRSVVMLAIMFLVRQKMAEAGRARKTALFIDEAWQMLGDGATGDFVEGFSRRCRKYGGSINTAAQTPRDYAKSAGARAAYKNADWRVVLPLTPDDVADARAQEQLPIDAATEDTLNSLKVSPSEFSEALIMGPHGQHVGRLVLDPYSAALYSSTPETVAAVDRLVKHEGLALEDAIQRIASAGQGKDLGGGHG